jgi:hypothetical protein
MSINDQFAGGEPIAGFAMREDTIALNSQQDRSVLGEEQKVAQIFLLSFCGVERGVEEVRQ